MIKMKLIDVTNSYIDLVQRQLDNTDTRFMKVYTLGKSTVLYSEAPTHCEIVIKNDYRKVKRNEIDLVIERLLPKDATAEQYNMIEMPHLVTISMPKAHH